MSYYNFYESLKQGSHLLIAGKTGSGKSVVVNGLITNIMLEHVNCAKLILIDPKRVELVRYKKSVYTLKYASEPDEMVQGIQYALDIIEQRYKRMQRRRETMSTDADIYLIIDEYADLVSINKKAVEPLIQRICQIGRAARVHCVLCTQYVSGVISTKIRCNFDCRVALKTATKQDSKRILDCYGCESLPPYGECYYMKNGDVERCIVPMYTDAEIRELTKNKLSTWGFLFGKQSFIR